MSVKLTEAQANKCSDSLPTKWTWVRLNEVVLNPTADIVDGPFGSNLHASEYVDEGVPLVRLQNVERNMFVNKNIQCITSKKAAELKRHSYSPNNILITKLGQPLGKACLVPQNIKSGIVVADVVRVKIDHDWVSKKYLVYAIYSNIVIEQIPEGYNQTTC